MLFYSSPQTIRGPYLLCIVHQSSKHMCHWCGEEECCRFHHKCHSQCPEYSHSAHHRYTGSCGSSGRQGSHCCTPHHCSTQAWAPCPHSLHWCSWWWRASHRWGQQDTGIWHQRRGPTGHCTLGYLFHKEHTQRGKFPQQGHTPRICYNLRINDLIITP